MEKSKVELALDARDEQDYQAYCILKQLLRAIDYNPGRKQFIAIIDEFGEDGNGILEEAEEAIKLRDKANEDFLQAIKDAAQAGKLQQITLVKAEA